jgi:hypothetical protein
MESSIFRDMALSAAAASMNDIRSTRVSEVNDVVIVWSTTGVTRVGKTCMLLPAQAYQYYVALHVVR